MCLSLNDVKTELRINAFYGAVHIPCSASAATKKCAPLRGFAFFCCAKPLQCKMRVVWRDVRHKGRSLHGQHFDRFHPSFNLRGRAKASRLARRRTLRQYAFGAHLQTFMSPDLSLHKMSLCRKGSPSFSDSATAKKTRPHFVGSHFFCCGGGEGIRTPVGLHPNGFQDRLVMTTSIRLRMRQL